MDRYVDARLAAGGGAVEAIPAELPDLDPADIGPILAVAPVRCTGAGLGRYAVVAGPVDAGPAAAAFFSAACRIWSLLSSSARSCSPLGGTTHSRRFRQAQQTTHSTQSSFPVPNVCQTCFSSSLFPVIVILVPPPFSGGFFATFPNCAEDANISKIHPLTAPSTHLNPLGWDLMTRILEVEHCPKLRVWIRFTDLI
jgi:hypothetical protein